jgi:hypothetical protein
MKEIYEVRRLDYPLFHNIRTKCHRDWFGHPEVYKSIRIDEIKKKESE